MKLKPLLLALPLAAFAAGLADVEKFLTVKGLIVAKSDNETYVCNVGLPYFNVGFPVAIYKGATVENPLTGKKSFVLLKETGKGEVIESFKENSIIRAVEDRGITVGNVVKLDYKRVCFKGSDFYFRKLVEAVPAVKVDDPNSCRWSVVETQTGFKVLFEGNEVFFAQKEMPPYAFSTGRLTLRDVRLILKASELKKFAEIPVAVDAVPWKKGQIVAVGFKNRIEIFQGEPDALTNIAVLPVPNGSLVGLRLVKVGEKVFILGNAFTSDAEPVSFVATLVGTNPIVIQKNLPYIVGVLNERAPERFVFIQKFDKGFGKVYRAVLGKKGLEIGEEIKVPEGFRVDTASYSPSGYLVFIDPSGNLKIYKGSFDKGFTYKLDLEGNFGYSYNYVDVPSVVGDSTAARIFFPPPLRQITLFGFEGFLVASNERENLSSFLGDKIFKLKKGRLIFVGLDRQGFFEKKTFIGASFEDAVQGFTLPPSGKPLLVSGRKNPFLFKKEGKLYKIEFRYF